MTVTASAAVGAGIRRRRALVPALLSALALVVAAQLVLRSERLATPTPVSVVRGASPPAERPAARAAPSEALGGAHAPATSDSASTPVPRPAAQPAPSHAIALVAVRERAPGRARRFVAVSDASSAELEMRTLAAALGASTHFELWAMSGGAACEPPADAPPANATAFAIRSRRTGRFVRARARGAAAEWTLTADVRWWHVRANGTRGGAPADAPGPFPAHATFVFVPERADVSRARPREPRAPLSRAAADADADADARADVVDGVALGTEGLLWSCGKRGFVNARPGGRLRTHSDAGPPFQTPAGARSAARLALVPRGVAGGAAGRADATRASRLLPPYRVVSIDYHIATARESGAVLRSFGLDFAEHSLSGACARTRTCASGLQVLTRENGFTLCPRPHDLRRRFFARYRSSQLVRGADAFICSHPAALCELFLPFNRALIVVVTTNLELARENPTRWADWLSVVRRLAADPRALVAANSAYDAAYVAHFARVTPVLLPTLAPYVDAAYAPTRDSYLLAPAHSDAARAFLEGARALCAPYVAVHWLRELYAEYSFEQLASHRAVVFVPYTKSVMSLFELYRMAVPIFAPSLELLVKLEMEQAVMSERIYWQGAPAPAEAAAELSPNTRSDRLAVEHWLALSDHLVFPHVLLFDSAADLGAQLRRATAESLRAVSGRMRAHMVVHEAVVRARWAEALERIFAGQRPGDAPVPASLDNELRARYGLELPHAEPDCSRLSAPDEGRWN